MKIRIIDLFAGIGGIRLGFEEAHSKKNVECVFTCEIDKYCQKTYLANWKNENIYNDITKLSDEEIEEIPDFDILLAGFPCQPFSQAGLKKGFNDTRGTLFFDIERILTIKQPKAFLLENVKALTYSPMRHSFQIMLENLRGLSGPMKNNGYNVPDPQILRAADFGVPQNRERVFIIGFKDKSVVFEYPEKLNIKTRVGDILDHNPDPKYTISDKLWAGHQRRKKQNKLNGKGFGYGIVNSETEYTNTISARYYKDGSEILINQGPNKNPRKLTRNECKNLQGFPDDYKLPKDVSDAQIYKQFGNSVCVPVIKHLAKKIISHIK